MNSNLPGVTNPLGGEAYHQLLQNHPQLSDKALIDWVNGLEVVDDQLRVRQSETGLLARIYGEITGSSALRQQQLDKNFHSGLSAALHGVQDLQNMNVSTNLAMELILNP